MGNRGALDLIGPTERQILHILSRWAERYQSSSDTTCIN
jgi:hypothetical protein